VKVGGILPAGNMIPQKKSSVFKTSIDTTDSNVHSLPPDSKRF